MPPKASKASNHRLPCQYSDCTCKPTHFAVAEIVSLGSRSGVTHTFKSTTPSFDGFVLFFFFFSLFFFFITYTKTQSPLLGETWPVAMQTVRHMFAAVYRCRNSWALRPAKLPCPLFFLLTSHTRILSLFFSFTPSCEYSFQTRVHHPAPVRLLLGGSPSQLVFSSKINRMHFGSNGSCLFNEQRETLGLCCSLLRGDDLGCDCCLWTWTLMMKSSQRNGVG